MKLVITPPGFLEANLVNKVENIESFHHDSLPKVTNFSQKMSEESGKKAGKVKGAKSALKKYHELEEEIDLEGSESRTKEHDVKKHVKSRSR